MELSSASPKSNSINDKALYRYSTLLAVRALRSTRPRKGSVLMLTETLCVKYGAWVHLSEAHAMRYISQHTSIPVPKVLCAFAHNDCTYIVMERIKGDMLGTGWLRRSEDSKARLLAQLKKLVQEMRELQAPKGVGVASIDGGSLYDARVPGPTLRFGPFRTIDEFHRHLRRGLEFGPDGDLSSFNILVREDDIVGVVDWETAGWYPSYWEYTTACQVNPQNSFWITEIDKFLDPMPEELSADRIRQNFFGDI
ncbi:aminoglycoside phosphotransferase family protein [Aspergillus alliaceus]|uniref:aminoglycoside phosphotransferase family protein n=1 Tax=Petromyces alliaceus TaxID=209559 RepID=UPI0012A5C298|nr:serine/threonine protein kinase [Aspergillus alliaceus]KAB8237170.1 serine/threonine protein kinase [Aspergillus alliaceus]